MRQDESAAEWASKNDAAMVELTLTAAESCLEVVSLAHTHSMDYIQL
jgi:hypothetical protein